MKIKSISFTENKDKDSAWELKEFLISNVNLIVAKNATGKSRTLNIISHLANLITGKVLVSMGHDYSYKVEFEGVSNYVYEIEVCNGSVDSEKLTVNGEIKIEKTAAELTNIYFDSIGQTLASQFDPKVVAVSQRDSLQKPYLEPLFKWASSTIHMRFGSPLGQNVFTVYSNEFEKQFDFKNTEAVASYFKIAEINDNLTKFKAAIIKDLNLVGYEIEDVGYCDSGLLTPDNKPSHKIFVKEKDIASRTYQEQMSQGMFRAVSILVQINYLNINNISTCLLIDDIGEGLDFERSTTLIDILCNKISDSQQQLLMTSNDRFIMNGVSLDYWSILVRKGQSCHMINKNNSADIFEEFEFTGLNNFDFFSTEFYKG